MALSPGIPTSFVPKQPTSQGPVRAKSGTNLFLVLSLVVAALACALAAGVFAYERYQLHVLATKQAALAKAQASVNEDTIDEFIRLRDRLTSGKDLLDQHIMLSQFLDILEADTLQNVRFSDMTLKVAEDHTAKIEMTGTAKSFNALAAQSNAFASEKRIKRAIFSGITLDQNLVTFKMTADVDPKLIVEDPSHQPTVQASTAALPAPTPTAATFAPTPAAQPASTTGSN